MDLPRSTDPPTGKRIVTSYEVLAQEYFREVDERAGLSPDDGTRIEYVSGSVEAACALGPRRWYRYDFLFILTHMPDGLMRRM
jgi:ATP phosphoribosyltransferase